MMIERTGGRAPAFLAAGRRLPCLTTSFAVGVLALALAGGATAAESGAGLHALGFLGRIESFTPPPGNCVGATFHRYNGSATARLSGSRASSFVSTAVKF